MAFGVFDIKADTIAKQTFEPSRKCSSYVSLECKQSETFWVRELLYESVSTIPLGLFEESCIGHEGLSWSGECICGLKRENPQVTKVLASAIVPLMGQLEADPETETT